MFNENRTTDEIKMNAEARFQGLVYRFRHSQDVSVIIINNEILRESAGIDFEKSSFLFLLFRCGDLVLLLRTTSFVVVSRTDENEIDK